MIRKIYIYLISFVTLMMTIGGSVSVFMALTDLIAPNPYVLTYNEYIESYIVEYDKEGEPVYPTGKEKEAYKAEYEDYVTETEEAEKKSALNRLIRSFGWVLIPLPIFVWMQRKLGKEEQGTEGK